MSRTQSETSETIDQYLDRLGLVTHPEPDAEGLRTLHRAHLESIPFENLDIHLGRPIRLDQESILNKIVGHNRGGYCYELNGAFAWLLDALGFRVSLLAAQVYRGESVGIPFAHACLRVDLDEPYLADVGFGASFLHPIELQTERHQSDPSGVFRLSEREDGSLDLLWDGTLQYRFTLVARDLADYSAANEYQQTSPHSHFTHNTICSRATSDGRVTIRGLELIETSNGERTTTELEPGALRHTLRQRFGIEFSAEEIERLLSPA